MKIPSDRFSKTFLAVSLVGILFAQASELKSEITNSKDILNINLPDKTENPTYANNITKITTSGGTTSVVFGDKTSLSGTVTATGGSNILTFDQGSFSSPISVIANGGNNTFNLNSSKSYSFALLEATSGTNTINQLGNGSFAEITSHSGGNNQITSTGLVTISGDILATGGTNKITLSDTSTSSITGNITADNSGNNTISGNINLTGNILATGGTNKITLSGGKITGYIAADETAKTSSSQTLGTATNINVITLNQNTTIQNLTTKTNDGAVIYASGSNSSNHILGNITATHTIKGHIIAKDNATNTLDLNQSILNLTGNILADNGTNKITLSDTSASSITGNITADNGGNNTISGNINLTGNVIATGGTNTITLSDTSASSITGDITANNSGNNTISGNIDLTGNVIAHNGTNTITSKKYNQTGIITADSTDSHNTFTLDQALIWGKTDAVIDTIVAKNNGNNTLQITGSEKNIIYGNILAAGGTNTITIGSSEHSGKTSITGAITAKTKDSSNVLTFYNTSILGDISSEDQGKNVLKFYDVSIDGNVTSQNTGINTLVFGDKDTKVDITGFIKAENGIADEKNFNNEITFANGSVLQGVIATGVNAKNKITLGGSDFIGNITSNILATNNGNNQISLLGLNFTGNILAEDNSKNSITDDNAQETAIKITGSIQASGKSASNSIVLKNISISDNILAQKEGNNTITIGSQDQAHQVNSSIYAQNANSQNTINFSQKSHLIGSIVATDFATNTITDQDDHIETLINGEVRAGGEDSKKQVFSNGKNTLVVKNMTITNGLNAYKKGENKVNSIANLLKSDVRAATEGKNIITYESGTLETQLISAISQGSNKISFTSGVLKGAIIIADTTINDDPVSASNDIEINNSGGGYLEIKGEESLPQDGIIAKGKGAINTIVQKIQATTNNSIVANILAEVSGKNTLTFSNTTMNGDIVAQGDGENTIVFGISTAESSFTSSIKGIYANANQGSEKTLNTITFEKATIKSPVQAFSTDTAMAENTITLQNSNIADGYLLAIASEQRADNILILDTETSIILNGVQVSDSQGQKVGTGKDAIYTDGANASNIFKNQNSPENNEINNQITINGNITAINNGKNEYYFNDLSMQGSVNALENNASNIIELGSGSESSASIPRYAISEGGIIAQGSNVSNAITLKQSSSLQNMYVESIQQTGIAKNNIMVNETSKVILRSKGNQGYEGEDPYAVYAKATTKASDDEGEDTGKQDNDLYQAINSILGESTSEDNQINGSILADLGKNIIRLTHLDITGNILVQNDGENYITISGEKSNAHKVTGGSISAEKGRNTLEFMQTNLSYKTLIAQGDGDIVTSNLISFGKTSSFKIGNDEKPENAISANRAINTIKSAEETDSLTGEVIGNITAENAGQNLIKENIKDLQIKKGYISANHNYSTNEIITTHKMTLDLIADASGNAISSNGTKAINKILAGDLETATQSKITGNIEAFQEGVNTIALADLVMQGSMLASKGGENTLTLGTKDKPSQTASKFQGSVIATTAKNTISSYVNTNFQFDTSAQKGSNAILSNNTSTNTITGTSSEESRVEGDIFADNGSNIIDLTNMSIIGDIKASNSGINTLNFGASKEINGNINATGRDSKNTMVSKSVGTLNASLVAEDYAKNYIYLTMEKRDDIVFNISTDTEAQNLAIIQNVENATSTITYKGGSAKLLLSSTMGTQNEIEKDITQEDYIKYDGILAEVNAKDADNILSDFREVFPINQTTITMKGLNHYDISGIYVGNIYFVKKEEDSPALKALNSVSLTINENSALIANIYNIDPSLSSTITTKNFSVALEKNAKWIINSSMNLKSLSATKVNFDANTSSGSTLVSNNTIVDFATGGYDSKNNIVTTNGFNSLSIENAGNLDGVIFRFRADILKEPEVTDNGYIRKTNDLLKIDGTTEQTTSSILQTYYNVESLKASSRMAYNARSLDKKLVIAEVSGSAKDNFSFSLNPTTVQQGYVLVTTNYAKRTENSTDKYYIDSLMIQTSEETKKNSFGILGLNYLVFLANTNNFNKRLGERRENDGFSDSVWIRTYGGQIVQDYGQKVTNNYIGVQGGIDYGIARDKSMHYLGVAFSYGDNFLKSSLWKTSADIASIAFYYSYARDKGFYSDSVLKYDYIHLRKGNTDLSDPIASHAFSLTQEFGYRVYFDNKERFYTDIQAEGIVGYLTKTSVLQSSDKGEVLGEVKGKSFLADMGYLVVRGRGAIVFGYALKAGDTRTDFRLGASYVGDYSMAQMRLDVFGDINTFQVPYNQMVVANLGINTKLGDSIRLYLDGEMGFMGKSINQTYAVNFGINYSFGTTKAEDFSFQDDSDLNVKNITIQAQNSKCQGCNPESGFYLEILKSKTQNPALNNYLSRFSYRIHTDSSGVTYYIGPFNSLEETRKNLDIANKITQAVTKNQNSQSEIYKIKNKSKN